MKRKLFKRFFHAFHMTMDMIFIDMDEVFLFTEKEIQHG